MQPRGDRSLFDVVFYENSKGEKPVEQYIHSLRSQKSKDARVKFNKIVEYIRKLSEFGTRVGLPEVDKIEGEEYLWELRPLKDRIFFAYWKDNTFVLLHHFAKKSRKTPRNQIEQAKRNLKDWKERFGD